MENIREFVVSLFALFLDQWSRKKDVYNVVGSSVLELQLLVDLLETHLPLCLQGTNHPRGRFFEPFSPVWYGSFPEAKGMSSKHNKGEKTKEESLRNKGFRGVEGL